MRDPVAEEIAKWEQELSTLDLDAPLYLPLGDHELSMGCFHHHSIAFDRYGERWRLIEVEGNDIDPSTYTSRLLLDAPANVRLEALRRLPTLYEAASREEERRACANISRS